MRERVKPADLDLHYFQDIYTVCLLPQSYYVKQVNCHYTNCNYDHISSHATTAS